MIKFEQKGPAERNHLPDDPWEDAYLRFETPEQEVRKFIGRLKFMDAMKWRRNAKIVELFCGRGSGLRALHQLGRHHLPVLPDDLDRVLAEGVRVLRENGLLLLIEPWVTLFLSMTHELCRSRVIRKLSPKIDALASMIHYERQTYENWLSHPGLILDSLAKAFRCERCHFRWGKIYFAGRKRSC